MTFKVPPYFGLPAGGFAAVGAGVCEDRGATGADVFGDTGAAAAADVVGAGVSFVQPIRLVRTITNTSNMATMTNDFFTFYPPIIFSI
jgi:hypothetical protein